MKSFLLVLLAGVTAAFISCTILPSGDKSDDSRSPVKKDGEVPLALDYRSWHKFISTVERADREEIREIYVNSPGMKGTETDGFPNGTTFVMEIFAAKRGSLILMPNESMPSSNTGSWRVEVYMTPQSLLLPTDAPHACRWLSAGCGWSFFVMDGPLDTGIHVPKGASVHVVSTGAIYFNQESVPRDPDGANDATPATYPAPDLRKHSLICKVGDSAWLQCGNAATITPEGSEALLRTDTDRLVKGKLQGLYLMQKGPDWGKESGYETGDWVFDHYSALTGELCAEEVGASAKGVLKCVPGLDIGRQHKKVAHANWSQDCRRCHVPAIQESGSHDRDFVYGYNQHFKIVSNLEKKRGDSSVPKKATGASPQRKATGTSSKRQPPVVTPQMPTYYDRPIEQLY
jgi:hypothetical protein